MACFNFAAIFTDHMVLQRNKNITVWGSAYNGTEITIELGGNKVTAVTDEGSWKAVLPAMEAGGPYELKATDNSGAEIVFHDVMIGEVWLAGGQSNMELELQNSLNGKEVVAEVLARGLDGDNALLGIGHTREYRQVYKFRSTGCGVGSL